MPKSVTYVSGINCHPSIRKGTVFDSASMLGGGQIVDQLDQLGFAAGLGQLGGVLAVHDDQRDAFDVIALRQLLRALQVGVDREGVVSLGEVIGADAVAGGEILLELERLLLAVPGQWGVLLLDGL